MNTLKFPHVSGPLSVESSVSYLIINSEKNQKVIYPEHVILVPHVGFFRGLMQEVFEEHLCKFCRAVIDNIIYHVFNPFP